MTCAEIANLITEIVAALATAAGTIIALYYSHKAVRSAEKARLEGLSDTTIEIMSLFYKSRTLFAKAKAAGNRNELQALVPKTQLNLGILELVVARPTLTDGGIAVGIGSKKLLEAILAQVAETDWPADGADLARNLPEHLLAVEPILSEASDRAEGVDRHAQKHKWPQWQRRMERIKEDAAKEQAEISPAVVAAAQEPDNRAASFD
jgi:hypothetical protein